MVLHQRTCCCFPSNLYVWFFSLDTRPSNLTLLTSWRFSPTDLYHSIFGIDFFDTYYLYVIVSLVAAYLMSEAYHNAAYWLRDRYVFPVGVCLYVLSSFYDLSFTLWY